MYNFALDAWEQGAAVLALIEAGAGRPAIANARATYEASVDALLLTSDLEVYDLYGARARIFELIEGEELIDRIAAADAELGLEDSRPTQPAVEDIVEQETQAWNDEAPGKGDLLQAFLTEARADPRWARGHWSGLSRTEVEHRLEDGWGRQGLAAMLNVLRGIAAIHSHPRPRTGFRALEEHGATLAFGENPSDAHTAISLATGAVISVHAALQRRRSGSFAGGLAGHEAG